MYFGNEKNDDVVLHRPGILPDDFFDYNEFNDNFDDSVDDDPTIKPPPSDDPIQQPIHSISDDDKKISRKNQIRRDAVRSAFVHAWNGYEKKAWGKDEVRPISGGHHNWVKGGMGMTIIDALDTAYIMGLDKIVEKSLSWIKSYLKFNIDDKISVFETTIRIVGGLISAYDLIGEPILLEKAKEITDRLLPAFNTKTGVPYSEVNLRTGAKSNQGWAQGTTLLAEFGTVQVEFRRLSHLTGVKKYDEVATKIMDVLERHSREDGQYPCFYYNEKDTWKGNLIKWGAWGDSFYEYLIKQHLLTNRTEERYRNMYDKAIDGMHDKLIKKSAGHTYIVEVDGGRVSKKMDHLVCFAIGMLVIGADPNHPRSKKDLETAKELGKTCYDSYHLMKSGLSPDSWKYNDKQAIIPDARSYLLRPETVEGLFYLYRATGDPIYQDWGWEIFQSIEKHCKTNYGYASVQDVTRDNPKKKDEMHTFFLGETLKYLYLLFSPMDLIPLDEFVFNTEAHPLRIYTPPKKKSSWW